MTATVTGKSLTVSVGYRLPFAVYEEANQQAQQRGVKLSVVLREATIRGLAELAGDDGRHGAADSPAPEVVKCDST